MFLWDEPQQAFVLKAWYGLERQPQRTIFTRSEVPAFARLRVNRQHDLSSRMLPPNSTYLPLPCRRTPAHWS